MSRPKPLIPLTPVLLRLHPDTVGALDRLRLTGSRSALLTELVRQMDERGGDPFPPTSCANTWKS